MYRTIIALSAVTLCACTAGPRRPGLDDYRPTAVSIHASFVDLPTTEVASASLSAYWLYAENDKPPSQRCAGNANAPFRSSEAQFELTAGATEYPDVGGLPELRFFTLYASLWASGTPPGASAGYWGQPGTILVYALSATTWSPFGPGGQTVSFPQGYSWLVRTCGPLPGQIQMEVHSIDESVELRHIEGDVAAIAGSSIEASERIFVQSCGAVLPTTALGTRVSFDRAQSLVWSPDATSIYYLSKPVAEDPEQSAGLRQIRPTDLVSWELTTIPHGAGLQIAKTGTLFVSAANQLLSLSPAAPTTPTPVPLPSGGFSAVVSPDGRWIAHDGVFDTQSGVHKGIWDVQANADIITFDGYLAGWSPDNRLAYWSSGLAIWSPAEAGGNPQTYPLAHAGTPYDAVAWTNAGPLIAFGYPDDQTITLGFSLVDPVTGAERPVLDANAGRISIVSTTPLFGATLVWAKSCLGILDTVCSYNLMKIDLASATAKTVATSTESVPMALSSNGRRLAFGASAGIYVTDLPQ
jgi:hypothetical protein